MKLLSRLVIGLLAIAAAGAIPVEAETLTYEVTGVSSDDVLNIRQAPRANAKKLGSYGPRDSGIRIYRRAGNWVLAGRANTGQPDGWVNTRYLKKTMASARIRLPLQCLGTEPFWSLTVISERRATYSDPDHKTRRYDVGDFQRAGKGAQMRLEPNGQVAIGAERCSDGMSDNVYPYAVSVTLPGANLLSGCCR